MSLSRFPAAALAALAAMAFLAVTSDADAGNYRGRQNFRGRAFLRGPVVRLNFNQGYRRVAPFRGGYGSAFRYSAPLAFVGGYSGFNYSAFNACAGAAPPVVVTQPAPTVVNVLPPAPEAPPAPPPQAVILPQSGGVSYYTLPQSGGGCSHQAYTLPVTGGYSGCGQAFTGGYGGGLPFNGGYGRGLAFNGGYGGRLDFNRGNVNFFRGHHGGLLRAATFPLRLAGRLAFGGRRW